ncbi:MAG: GTP cyclohydrolase I FolE2 [Bdellovibrionales bacterium]|nr:GTP cyclohydrolase I FolE2 [Bdellovibrionales bacterium]
MKIVEYSHKSETSSVGGSVRQLPDITTGLKSQILGTLDWVGMESIELPVMVEFEGKKFFLNAMADCFVSLDDPKAKGIHMSRLYGVLMNHFISGQSLSQKSLEDVVQQLSVSQLDISRSARLKLKLDWPVIKTSLKSQLPGFRHYPLEIDCIQTPETTEIKLAFRVTYSSTCPCSAALSRQLNSENFMKQFSHKETVSPFDISQWMQSQESVVATPHAQRSVAEVQLKTSNFDHFGRWIQLAETALGTPVQTAVKREDEQEFARLNAENLMFCEDAARKLQNALSNDNSIDDFWIKVSHEESLHPHNAVAYTSKSQPSN